MPLKIYQVDAFTNRPFAGNPAAVCILPEPRSAEWMQNVALEMNLSETAFLNLQPDGYQLRWFTPTVEEDLCGHATLASAHVLWQEGHLPHDNQARFHTRSGLLTARRVGEYIELDFPVEPASLASPPPDLIRALGVALRYVGKNRMDYLVEVESESEVRQMKPNFSLLESLAARGVIVTAKAVGPPYDFVSRFFAPGSGIREDPVTGSAHCCLGPYWQARLAKNQFLAYQASSRGGIVQVEVKGNRVLLGGQAVTVLRAELVE